MKYKYILLLIIFMVLLFIPFSLAGTTSLNRKNMDLKPGQCWNQKTITKVEPLYLWGMNLGTKITWTRGCNPRDHLMMVERQNECILVLGSGNVSKINIVLFSYNLNNDTLHYFMRNSRRIESWLEEIEPFSSNPDKFNLYFVLSGESIDLNQRFVRLNGKTAYSDNVDRYLSRVCDTQLNKKEDIIFLVDLTMWDGFGGRRNPNACMAVDNDFNNINPYGGFCPALAATGSGKMVTMHELGHAFGLVHDMESNNFMSYNLKSNHYSDSQVEQIMEQLKDP
jgi:hypothetical protein